MDLSTEDKEKKTKKTKLHVPTLLLTVLLGLTVALVVGMKYGNLSGKPMNYRLGETAFTFPTTLSQYVGVNTDQIIRITKDSIIAYNLKGEEVWADTMTLEQVVVKQKEPYFAVTDKHSRKISVFSEEGKEGEIVTDSPVVYFSINVNGDVATIEETKDGHIISAYEKTGRRIPGQRITYIETAGFPIAVEVSPDRSMLLASYVDIYSPIVTTKVVGVLLAVAEEEAVDNVKFGKELQDNIIYEIEYIDESTWVAIGDKGIQYYDQAGESLAEIEPKYLKYTPYVHSDTPYLPVLESSVQGNNMIYGEQMLTVFDAKGQPIGEQTFEGIVTYYYPDDKGIIIGQGKNYQGFDVQGNLTFTLHATQDIEALRYIGRKPVAITKNEVILLEGVEEAKK